MRQLLVSVTVCILALSVHACNQGTDDSGKQVSPGPNGGCEGNATNALIPGPCEEGYDAGLEGLARLYDRQFHVFHAYGMGLNADITVPLDRAGDRDLIHGFLRGTEGWDFGAYAGRLQGEVVTEWQPVAGLYAGVGIAADAYRYGVLRDRDGRSQDAALARQHLLDALQGLHIAVAITGTPGVIARGYVRTDIPGTASGIPLTPLFDEHGNPLPREKDNGTWRADNSGGLYPNYIWIDSCSRDQYIGWAAGFAAAWEVIRDDPSFSIPLKAQMKDDARELGRQLSVVRPSGFDLEIPDADGRTTYHGYLNENNFDRLYLPFLPFDNGMYAMMALGIVAALHYVADDPELERYLNDTLIKERGLHRIARDNQIGVDLGVQSNYSAYNMAFMGAWLALRYIADSGVWEDLEVALDQQLYARPGRGRQPAEIGQSLFDFIYAASMAGAHVEGAMSKEPDVGAVMRGTETLLEFSTPPYWEFQRTNCDEAEIAALSCEGDDGTHFDLLGFVGRGDKLVARQPVPMRIRPPSNYHWRSNPYEVNGGGDGSRLLPGVDFRYAYWLGRWVR